MSGARWTRWALIALDAFTALTAIGGGLALAAGLEGARFPTEWLVGTPFTSYVVPGLILAIIVGGSAAVATALTVRGGQAAATASVAAGAILIGWIVGEVLILTNDGELISPTELVYLVVGVAMVALGAAGVRSRVHP